MNQEEFLNHLKQIIKPFGDNFHIQAFSFETTDCYYPTKYVLVNADCTLTLWINDDANKKANIPNLKEYTLSQLEVGKLVFNYSFNGEGWELSHWSIEER